MNYNERVAFLNSTAMVSITKDIVNTLNKINKIKMCLKHNELHSELWEGELLCASCYEEYFLNKEDSLELNYSNEYNQLMQDSD